MVEAPRRCQLRWPPAFAHLRLMYQQWRWFQQYKLAWYYRPANVIDENPWQPFEFKNQIELWHSYTQQQENCQVRDKSIDQGKQLVHVTFQEHVAFTVDPENQEHLAFTMDPDWPEPFVYEIAVFWVTRRPSTIWREWVLGNKKPVYQ